MTETITLELKCSHCGQVDKRERTVLRMEPHALRKLEHIRGKMHAKGAISLVSGVGGIALLLLLLATSGLSPAGTDKIKEIVSLISAFAYIGLSAWFVSRWREAKYRPALERMLHAHFPGHDLEEVAFNQYQAWHRECHYIVMPQNGGDL